VLAKRRSVRGGELTFTISNGWTSTWTKKDYRKIHQKAGLEEGQEKESQMNSWMR
jgi:hypothetical protein